MVIFAIGVTLGTLLVLRRIDSDVVVLGQLAGEGSGRLAVATFAHNAEVRWISAFAAFLIFSAASVAILVWAHTTIARRIAELAEYAGSVAAPDATRSPPEFVDDALGVLQQRLERLGTEIRDREERLHRAAATQQLDVQIQRALSAVESEQEAFAVARRVLNALSHEDPSCNAELLVADSSHAHLRRVLPLIDAPPACPVQSPSQCLAVRRGQTTMFANTRALDVCPRFLAAQRDGCAATCLPVTVAGRSVGVLNVLSAEDAPLRQSTVDALESLTSHLGSRLAILRALEMSQVQAETDPLTGIFNRRTFEARSTPLLGQGTDVAVVMCDLDHFKKLNDTRGHDAGDRALRRFATTLRRALRPEDIVARYGGEEFVAVLPNCSAKDAAAAMNRVRALLASTLERGDVPFFTVSIGIAAFPTHGETLEELVCVADDALYAAKRNGRDRVEVAPGAPALKAVSA
jgi:diguanylate cyclase (GGDEF)-like protein